jgi:hypothetical protein
MVRKGLDVMNIAWPFAAVETASDLMDCRLDFLQRDSIAGIKTCLDITQANETCGRS